MKGLYTIKSLINRAYRGSTKVLILNLNQRESFKLQYLHSWSTSKFKKSKLGFENLVSNPDFDVTINQFSAKFEFYDLLSDNWDLGLDSLTINITRDNLPPSLLIWSHDMRSLHLKLSLIFERASTGIE